jgi:hypothetical protein
MIPNPPATDFKGVIMSRPDIFTAHAIQDSVNKFLVDNPQAKGGALLSVTSTDGINLVLATKLNNRWFVEAYIGKKWGAPVEGGIKGVVFF